MGYTQTNAKLQADAYAVRGCVAKMQPIKRCDLAMIGGWSLAIDKAVDMGLIVRGEDGMYSLPIAKATAHPRTRLIKSPPLMITCDAPTLIGCTLKNPDTYHSDQYYLFVGEQTVILGCASTLLNAGVQVHPKPNGKNGAYKIIVPLWVTGTIEPENIFEMEEDHVNQSSFRES